LQLLADIAGWPQLPSRKRRQLSGSAGESAPGEPNENRSAARQVGQSTRNASGSTNFLEKVGPSDSTVFDRWREKRHTGKELAARAIHKK